MPISVFFSIFNYFFIVSGFLVEINSLPRQTARPGDFELWWHLTLEEARIGFFPESPPQESAIYFPRRKVWFSTGAGSQAEAGTAHTREIARGDHRSGSRPESCRPAPHLPHGAEGPPRAAEPGATCPAAGTAGADGMNDRGDTDIQLPAHPQTASLIEVIRRS